MVRDGQNRNHYLFALLQPGNSLMYSHAQTLGLGAAVLICELVRKSEERVDPIRDAPPCPLEPSGVALTIDAE